MSTRCGHCYMTWEELAKYPGNCVLKVPWSCRNHNPNDPRLQNTMPRSSAKITNAAPSCQEPLKTKDITSEVIKHFDEAVECARLIGHTEAMKIHGAFTKIDSRFVVAMYESIEKHENAIKKILDKRFEE